MKRKQGKVGRREGEASLGTQQGGPPTTSRPGLVCHRMTLPMNPRRERESMPMYLCQTCQHARFGSGIDDGGGKKRRRKSVHEPSLSCGASGRESRTLLGMRVSKKSELADIPNRTQRKIAALAGCGAGRKRALG